MALCSLTQDTITQKFYGEWRMVVYNVILKKECLIFQIYNSIVICFAHFQLIHSDLPQQICPNCPASFLSIEELEAHKKKHVRIHRPFVCNMCDKKWVYLGFIWTIYLCFIMKNDFTAISIDLNYTYIVCIFACADI